MTGGIKKTLSEKLKKLKKGTIVTKKDSDNLTEEERIAILKVEEVYRKGLVSVQDIIAPSALQINPNYLKLNNKFVRTLFIYTFPRFLMTGWFAPVINLNFVMDIAMFIQPVSSEKILKTLRSRSAQIQSSIAADVEKGKVRDPMLEAALRNVEELRDALIQGIEKFFHLGLYITIYEDSLEELERTTSEIEGILGHKLVYSRQTMFLTEQGFNSTLPLGDDQLAVLNNLNTSPLSTAFPFVSSELTSDTGILYGINRHNNSLILFDRFTLTNANSVVFATSGAGKSYTVKLEILRSMMWGVDVLVVDPENEYKYLAESVGGSFLRLSLDADYRINPFDLPPGIPGESTEDILRSAVINIKGLMRLILGRMTKEEDSLVDSALLETYARKDITGESDLASVVPPTMEDFQNILSGMRGGDELALRLDKYTKGTFAGLFNKPSNIDLRKQLVVFSIRDLEEELRPIAMYIIINYIWNIVRSRMKRRILVVDEAWWMMQHEDSARFMFSIAKRGRKYYMGLTTISQDVNDFLTNEFGRAIVTNAALQILLKQSSAAIDLLAKTFSLTDQEKYLLTESAVGEGIFFAGNKHVAIKVVASYSEDQMITTDPKQLLEIEKAKEEFSQASSS